MVGKEASKEKQAELELKPHCETCGRPVDNESIEADARCNCNAPGSFDTGANACDPSLASGTDKIFPVLGDRFEVLKFIGEGGMGSVFKVRDKLTSSVMALKVIKTGGCEGAEAVKRFEGEVKAAAKLTHPNIVAVFDHGKTADGAPYMVMTFIEGENLASHVKEHGKLNEADAVQVFIDIAEALQYAHQQGLIHRDLKPSNVIVSGDNERKNLSAQLVDFGIAKAMTASMARDTQDLTKTGEVFGSPAYMSPEQCLGFRLDARSDIYSFGCLMYEALTGTPPVSDDNPVRIVVKQLSEKPKSWTNTPDGKPLKGLEAIVFRCLEKDKEERYQTVAELLKDLNLIASGKQPAKFEPTQAAKASLTVGQALTFAFLGIFLFVYLTSVYVSYIYSVFSVILFPVALALTLRHLITLKFGGTNWNRWQLLIRLTMTFLGLTGIIVFTGFCPFWDNLPDAFHYLYAIDSVLHKTILCVACGLIIAGFTFQDSSNLSWKRISKQALLFILPLLIIGFAPLGTLSPIIPSSLTTRMSFPPISHKLDAALAITSLRLGGDKIWAANELAESYQKMDEPEKALPILTEAIEKHPDSSGADDALANRARAYLATKQYKNALLDLDKALNANNTRYSAHQYYDLQGDVYKAMGDIDKAMSSYQRSLEAYPSYNPSSDKLIALLLQKRDWKQAIDALNKNIQTNQSAENVIRRAMVHDLAGLKAEAKTDYEFCVNQLANIEDSPPDLGLDFPTNTIIKITQAFIPRIDYKKEAGIQYLIRAYANQHLGKFEQASKDLKDGESRGASFADVNEIVEKGSGLKLGL